MSRWWWWLVLALVLSIGINVGLVASRLLDRRGGQHRLSGIRPRPAASQSVTKIKGVPPWIDRLADHVALAGERRERFVAIQRSFLEVVEERRWSRRQVQLDLHRALLRPEPDRDEIGRMLRRIGEENAGLERAFAENVLASRGMLEPAEERRFLESILRLRLKAEQRRGR